MNRKLLVAIVSGVLAAPMAVQVQADETEVKPHSHPATYEHEHEMEDGSMSPLHAHEHESHPHSELHGHSATVYGSLRYGVAVSDNGEPGGDNVWDLGSNRSSRFGIKGSMPAGAGLTAGFHLERALNSGLTERHHNVSLSGDFGTLKFGRQGSPYYGATTWDGSQTLGGLTDPIFRTTGTSFSSSLGGPFDFSVLLSSNAGGGGGDGADHVEVTGSLATGPVSMNVAYMKANDGEGDLTDDAEHIGGTVGGNVGAISWKAGYVSATDECGADCDQERFGFHVGYAIGDGNAYAQYSDQDSDNDMADKNGWVFGYWHALAPNVVVYAEHGTTDTMDEMHDELTATATVVAVKVGF